VINRANRRNISSRTVMKFWTTGMTRTVKERNASEESRNKRKLLLLKKLKRSKKLSTSSIRMVHAVSM